MMQFAVYKRISGMGLKRIAAMGLKIQKISGEINK